MVKYNTEFSQVYSYTFPLALNAKGIGGIESGSDRSEGKVLESPIPQELARGKVNSFTNYPSALILSARSFFKVRCHPNRQLHSRLLEMWRKDDNIPEPGSDR